MRRRLQPTHARCLVERAELEVARRARFGRLRDCSGGCAVGWGDCRRDAALRSAALAVRMVAMRSRSIVTGSVVARNGRSRPRAVVQLAIACSAEGAVEHRGSQAHRLVVGAAQLVRVLESSSPAAARASALEAVANNTRCAKRASSCSRSSSGHCASVCQQATVSSPAERLRASVCAKVSLMTSGASSTLSATARRSWGDACPGRAPTPRRACREAAASARRRCRHRARQARRAPRARPRFRSARRSRSATSRSATRA